MKEKYRKIHSIKHGGNQNIEISTHIRVYRNRGKKLIVMHPFLMSNLEGILAFFRFPVSSRLFRSTVKILVEVIQFPVKVGGFFFGRFIGFL